MPSRATSPLRLIGYACILVAAAFSQRGDDLVADTKFDLVTNRNAPAPSATSVLGAPGFLDKVTKFLDDSAQGKDGEVLKQLVERLRRETTRKVEDQYQENQNRLRDELQRREHFVVKSSPALA
ncbi:MAG TPA: hypothetical protein PKK40_04120, partial [Marmoricola sp.]|nr:hypothetical protein [Marmoricola sp.]